MTEYTRQKYRFFSAAVFITGFLFVFFPWLKYDEKVYSLIKFLAKVWKSGGPMEYADNDLYRLTFVCALHIPAVTGILAGIYAAGLTFRKNFRRMYQIILCGTFLYLAFAMVFFPYDVLLWTYLLVPLYLVEFLVRKYLTERQEFTKWKEAVRREEKEEKEEEKRRLAFEGKYSRQLYKVVLTNMKYRIRSYIMLIVSAGFFVMFLFLLLALQALFKNVHSEEMLFLGNGLQKILIQAMQLGLICNIIMMALSFSYYLRNKLKDENILVLLGIRSETLNGILRFEYIGCMICAVILGLVTGNVVFCILKKVLEKKMTIGKVHIPLKYYLAALAIFVVAVLAASVVNYEIYRNSTLRDADNVAPNRPGIPGRLALIPGAVGLGFLLLSISGFMKRANGEKIGLQCLFFMGVILCLFCVQAFFLKKLQKNESCYYRNLVSRMDFFVKFKKNIVTMGLLCTVHILIMYTFTSEIAGIMASPGEAELYPYDFVCMSYEEEDDFFAELKETYGLKMYQIPMFRVTSVQGEAADWVDGMSNYFMRTIWSQGQHAGISESSYNILLELLGREEKELDLKGENIHVVYQQDVSFKAHPIDWYLAETAPFLRNGQPVKEYSYLDREKLYPKREVQSEEIGILTGMFVRGEEENLIVFSDEYFEKARREVMARNEGPEEMILLKVTDDNYYAVDTALQEFAERHQEDCELDRNIRPYYGKQQMINDTKSERYLKLVVWIFVIIAVGFSGVLLVLLKFVFEMDEIVRKYQFLSCMGMRGRDMKKEMRREMIPFWLWPFIISAAGTAIFTSISFGLRMMSVAEMRGYMHCAAGIWMVYWLVQVGCFVLIHHILLKKIQEGQEP